MFKLNFESQFEKLKTVLNMWAQRDLTPIGKITIIKSLALSQMTYLFSVLPKPPNEFIKKLEQVLFNFIWNGKPDKIKRSTLYLSKQDGGLNMVNIHNFIDALKITWVKRFLDEKNKASWKILFSNELLKIGDEWIWFCNPKTHIDFRYEKIDNEFLCEVLKSWFALKKTQKENLDEVLWYNSKIKINRKTIYYKSWSSEGINFVSDLIIDKHWMTYEEFRHKFNINCNFLKYYGVIHAISTCFQNQLIDCKQNHVPQLLCQIRNAKRVCSFSYQLLCDKTVDTPTAQHKWAVEYEAETGINCDIDWKQIYSMPFKCTIETKCHYFQFRFIHKVLPTNEYLSKIGIKDNEKCSFCKTNVETMKHLMWNCKWVSTFWKEVINWLTSLDIFLDISYMNICLGIYDTEYSSFINMLFILAKKYIYKCRVQDDKVIFSVFKDWIFYTEKVEKYIAIKKEKQNSHYKKWEPLMRFV